MTAAASLARSEAVANGHTDDSALVEGTYCLTRLSGLRRCDVILHMKENEGKKEYIANVDHLKSSE